MVHCRGARAAAACSRTKTPDGAPAQNRNRASANWVKETFTHQWHTQRNSLNTFGGSRCSARTRSCTIGPAPVPNWVLVVEDNDDTLASLVDLLQTFGFPAKGASGIADALILMRDDPPAVVLSDFSLQDGCASEFLAAARQIFGPSVPPFVVVTGWQDGLVKGIPSSVRILKKPPAIEDLLRIVETYCTSSMAQAHSEPTG